MGDNMRLGLAIAVISSIVLGIVFLWFAEKPPTEIRLATGRPGGSYEIAGEQIKKVLARSGVKVELIRTKGTDDNLNRLTSSGADRIDAAIIQSGRQAAATKEGIANLGAIFLEPIWIFGRNLPPGADLRRLVGKKVAVGARAFDPNNLANVLFTENGLSKEDVTFVPLDAEASADALLAGKVDAAWMVGGVDSKWVLKLLELPELELVNFDRAAAYARVHSHLEDVVLSEGAIDLGRNIPGHDIKLVGPTAQMIVRSKLHPALQSLLLDAMHEIFSRGDAVSAPGKFPNKDLIDISLSQEARRYYASGPTFFRRVLPYWAASFAERAIFVLIPLFTLLLPVAQSLPPFLNWRVRGRINVWYHQLRLIEAQGISAQTPEDRAQICNRLEEIMAQVGRLKVPLNFADDVYRLRAHIRFVLDAFRQPMRPA